MTAEITDLIGYDQSDSDGDKNIVFTTPLVDLGLWTRAAEPDRRRENTLATKMIESNGQLRDLGWTETQVRGPLVIDIPMSSVFNGAVLGPVRMSKTARWR